MGFTPADQAYATSQGPGVIIACQADKRFKEFSVDDNAQPTDAKVSARRRLLRGAFSAPAVLTLYSGSALANASSQRCLVNEGAGAAALTTTADAGPGGYARVRLYKWTSGSGFDNRLYVRGKYLPGDPLKRVTSSVPSNSQMRRFDTSINDWKAGSTLVADQGDSSMTPQDQYAAVRVDTNGNIVGVGTSGGGYNIHNSCWTSFIVNG